MAGNRIITLTTDFGHSDAYVGIMKGVILSIAPNISLVDITHDVHPQDIAGAAYHLQSAYSYFPDDTVHLVVVDPGVGTSRKPIAVETPKGLFVGPDNGVLFAALVEGEYVDPATGDTVRCAAVSLDRDKYWLRPVSQTFHGRDIFSPIAAHLALGVPIADVGSPLTKLKRRIPEPPRHHRGVVYGSIVHIDRFGNAVTNVQAEAISGHVSIEVGERTIDGLATSYQQAQVVALTGSSGLIEIAARNASAADSLGLRVGDAIVIRKRS